MGDKERTKTFILRFRSDLVAQWLMEGGWNHTHEIRRGLQPGARLVETHLEDFGNLLVLTFEAPWYEDCTEELAVEVFCP